MLRLTDNAPPLQAIRQDDALSFRCTHDLQWPKQPTVVLLQPTRWRLLSWDLMSTRALKNGCLATESYLFFVFKEKLSGGD